MKLVTSPYETHRHNITKFLNKLCPNGVGAEIGVKQGKFSKVLLSGWHDCKMHLIDPWEVHDKSIYDENVNDYQSDYNKTIDTLKDFSHRYEIIRQYSNDAHSNFAKNSLDFIYIDGDHSYEGVKADINNYFNKLKKDTISFIGGHDYTNEWPGVVSAIDEAFPEKTKQKFSDGSFLIKI